MSKTVKISILISIILNFALLGIIGGSMYKMSYGFKSGGYITKLVDESSIPEDRKNALKQQLRQSYKKHRNRAQSRELQEKIITLLKTKPFDAITYRQYLEEIISKHHQNKQRYVDTMVEIATHLNDEERRLLANNFSKVFKKLEKRKHR